MGTSQPVELSDVAQVTTLAARVVSRVEPDAVPLTEAPSMWREFDRLERLATSAKTLLARRVEESKQWKREGFRSPAEHLASLGGTTIGTARDALAISSAVQSLPSTEAAVRAGSLSTAQASAVISAAVSDPTSERRLLEQAETVSLAELREECLRTRSNADPDQDTTYRRIHEQRRLRTWTDAEGAWNLVARGTPDAGAAVIAALKPLIDERFTKAREGEREQREAYAFDALVALATRVTEAVGTDGASTKKPNRRFLSLLRVDLAALTRGATVAGEVCELSGLGPIPVSRARALLGESTLRLVITKGVDVANVTHLGRGPTAAQRIALLWSSPTCVVEGCTRTRVEIDHRTPWSDDHRTRLENLDPLCAHHHDRKTRDGWSLVNGKGKRPMVSPGDPRHPHRRGAGRAPPDEHAA